MQRGQYQVTGITVVQRVLHGLQIAYLADHDHVRGFAQDVAQGLGKTHGIEPDFPLVDDGFLVPVEEFDRVFDADNVPGAVGGAVVEHGGQGGRFAGAGGADNQNQAAVEHHQLFQNRGSPSSAIRGILLLMCRTTMATSPRW